MPILLLGFAVLILILLVGKPFAAANSRRLAKELGEHGPRLLGAIAALMLAALLAVRGAELLALPLGLAGLILLGLMPFRAKAKRRTARVRSAFLEVELDRDTGAVRGRILADPHYGTSLDALPVATLMAFLPKIDEESRDLLGAYLDRRAPGWREHAQADAAAGQGAAARAA